MKAFLYWSFRDWLNPKNGFDAALPPDDRLTEEATSVKWSFTSTAGSIIIEPKVELKKRIGRSPDELDSVANSFYPVHKESGLSDDEILADFM